MVGHVSLFNGQTLAQSNSSCLSSCPARLSVRLRISHLSIRPSVRPSVCLYQEGTKTTRQTDGQTDMFVVGLSVNGRHFVCTDSEAIVCLPSHVLPVLSRNNGGRSVYCRSRRLRHWPFRSRFVVIGRKWPLSAAGRSLPVMCWRTVAFVCEYIYLCECVRACVCVRVRV